MVNFVFTGAASLGIAWLAARGFLSGGHPGLILLGCGALCWGIGTMVAASLLDRG